MLSLELALALRDAGLSWSPVRGDHFVVPGRDLDDHVFVLSDMVVEILDVPDGPPLLAFNGTTEWALDDVEASAALWLPREDQLRQVLGEAFVSLVRLPEPGGGHAVTVEVHGGRSRFLDVDAESAYARAVLHVRERGYAG